MDRSSGRIGRPSGMKVRVRARMINHVFAASMLAFAVSNLG